MTDSDIIKALECCFQADCDMCDECPYKKFERCIDRTQKDAAFLIRVQQAEIERLKAEHDALIRNYKECAMEAVRDFAERLKATFPPRDSGKCTLDDCYTLDKIDEIVAEMEG